MKAIFFILFTLMCFNVQAQVKKYSVWKQDSTQKHRQHFRKYDTVLKPIQSGFDDSFIKLQTAYKNNDSAGIVKWTQIHNWFINALLKQRRKYDDDSNRFIHDSQNAYKKP